MRYLVEDIYFSNGAVFQTRFLPALPVGAVRAPGALTVVG